MPIVVGRLTRSRQDLPPSYHGGERDKFGDYLVQTEYGADFWRQVLEAGFAECRIVAVQPPAAHAVVGLKSLGMIGIGAKSGSPAKSMVARLETLISDPTTKTRAFLAVAKTLTALSRINLSAVDVAIRVEVHEDLGKRVAELEARMADNKGGGAMNLGPRLDRLEAMLASQAPYRSRGRVCGRSRRHDRSLRCR